MRKSTVKTVFLPSVRVPAQVDAELRQAAQRQGVPLSTVPRQALTWYLTATKSNPQTTSDKVTT